MINYGITTEELKRILGHASIEPTLELYKNASDNTNILASIRDHALKKVENGDKRYKKILEALEV